MWGRGARIALSPDIASIPRSSKRILERGWIEDMSQRGRDLSERESGRGGGAQVSPSSLHLPAEPGLAVLPLATANEHQRTPYGCLGC